MCAFGASLSRSIARGGRPRRAGRPSHARMLRVCLGPDEANCARVPLEYVCTTRARFSPDSHNRLSFPFITHITQRQHHAA